jgi:SEC-C motif-containing protein
MNITVRNAPCACGSGRKYKRCRELQMPKASLRGSERVVPSVYQSFSAHGISSWVTEAMTRASCQ